MKLTPSVQAALDAYIEARIEYIRCKMLRDVAAVQMTAAREKMKGRLEQLDKIAAANLDALLDGGK